MGPSLLLVDFIFFVLALYLLKRITTTRPALPFPPGPPGLPLLHNLLDWPYSNEWVTFTEWAHKYGTYMLYQTIVFSLGPSKQATLSMPTLRAHTCL
jgi:hypothetical protein